MLRVMAFSLPSDIMVESIIADGRTYESSNRISFLSPRKHKDSTFVYLSNIEEIPFGRAYMAAGLSSSTDDYFSPEEAVLVEMR